MKMILLVEPGYKNKYPPLGLMKIATYHKFRGDYVSFVKGCNPLLLNQKWDRVYISTLFTFHWKKSLETILFYRPTVESNEQIIVGGVMATLLSNEIRKETGARVLEGLLDKPGILDANDKQIIDTLPPDYNILNNIEYKYGIDDAYIGYATRGCPNHCGFCAVNRLEPTYINYLPIMKQIQSIERLYGAKQNLILLDNNVLASNKFEQIIKDIRDLGFEKGARYNGKTRWVDFNQGIDVRLLTKNKMELLSTINIKPLRLAFDHISLKDKYVRCIRQAVKCDITSLSNYVLYNYTDTPQDFYERLKINVKLNKELGIHIYSFPMKYIPLNAKDRNYIGKNWNRRLLRGVQCILLATMGKVGTNLEFFKAAFGETEEEFIEIAMMPDEYIINRAKNKFTKASAWRKEYRKLSNKERRNFIDLFRDYNHVMVSLKKDYPRLASHYCIKAPVLPQPMAVLEP